MSNKVVFLTFEDEHAAQDGKKKITDYGHTAMISVMDPKQVQISGETYHKVLRQMGVLSSAFNGITKIEFEDAESVGSAP